MATGLTKKHYYALLSTSQHNKMVIVRVEIGGSRCFFYIRGNYDDDDDDFQK